MTDLTGEQHTILDIERQRWPSDGYKAGAIRDQLGISTTVYYARLAALLDDPVVQAVEPTLVGRLRRLRDLRRAHRTQHSQATL